MQIFAFVLFAAAGAMKAEASAEEKENPIRKIVSILQNMQGEIDEEGARAKENYEKYMCFCETNIKQTTDAVEEGGELVSQKESEIKELTGQNAQIDSELTELVKEIADSTKSVEEQSAQRKSEASKFLEESTETKNSIAGIDKALPALMKGVSFAEQKKILIAVQPLARNTPLDAQVTALIQGSSEDQTSGSSDQIIGILQQMTENFKDNLKDMIMDEEDAIAKYNELMGSKNEEISAGEKETTALKARHASNAMAASESKLELEKAKNALASSTDRLVDLKKGCGDRTTEFDAATKGRQLELEAIGQAVKILNDDSALDLFKKTMPSPSLIQEQQAADPAAQAWKSLEEIRPASFVQVSASASAKAKPAFDGVIKLVGGMQAGLTTDQGDEDKERDFCKAELATTEKTKVGKVGDLELVVQEIKELENTQQSDKETVAKLEGEIKAIELALSDASVQREKDKTEFTKVSSASSQAINLITKAREVLAKQYSSGGPALLTQTVSVVPGSKADTDMESMLGLGFTQTKMIKQDTSNLDKLLLEVGEDATGAVAVHEPKSKEGTGVIGLMDEMKHDIELELAELKHDEEEQLNDYTAVETESNLAIKDKKKEITGRLESKARTDEKTDIRRNVADDYQSEIDSLTDKLGALHEQCDFLLENYDTRKKARGQEIEGLAKSKAVLQGATLDLHQQTSSLRGL